MRDGKGDDEDHANQGTCHRHACEQSAIAKAVTRPAVRPAGHNDDGTTGEAVQKTLEGGEAETFDELAEEGRQAAVRDVRQDAVHEERPD